MGNTYAEKLGFSARVTRPAIEEAMCALALENGGIGLDAGCGAGMQSAMLAEKTGAAVVGVDLSQDNLIAARDAVSASRPGTPLLLNRGDLLKLPFRKNVFDWAWCCDVLWPVVIPEPVEGIKALARVVKPGGTVAVLYWTAQQLLPGYPELEARLNLGMCRRLPYFKFSEPGQHNFRALEWFQKAGLLGARGRSFVSSFQGPMDASSKEALAFLFSMLYGKASSDLPPAEKGLFDRLTRPGSSDFLPARPGYFGHIIYTMFHAQVQAY